MATLPTDRDTSDTAADHATDHNTVHGLWNKLTTKGDLLTATGAQAYSRLGVGSNGQVLTADSAESTGIKWATPSGSSVFADYTPTLTQSGSVTKTVTTARYCEIGKLVMLWIRLDVTGTGTASNMITVSLPVTASASNRTVGHGVWVDSSAGDSWFARIAMSTTTTVLMSSGIDDGTGFSLGAAAPAAAALGSGDVISFFACYEAA